MFSEFIRGLNRLVMSRFPRHEHTHRSAAPLNGENSNEDLRPNFSVDHSGYMLFTEHLNACVKLLSVPFSCSSQHCYNCLFLMLDKSLNWTFFVGVYHGLGFNYGGVLTRLLPFSTLNRVKQKEIEVLHHCIPSKGYSTTSSPPFLTFHETGW